MKNKRWPTPLKKLRERFPDADLVQMRITLKDGSSVSFDGKPTPALKEALFEIVSPQDPNARTWCNDSSCGGCDRLGH